MHRLTIVLPLFSLCLPAADATVRMPVLLEDAPGCRVTSRRAELLPHVPTADAQGRIIIDARQPTRFSHDPQTPERDDDGLLSSEFLLYDFHVATSGSYVVYVRVVLPPGHFRFIETIDGRRYTGPFDEENGGSEQVARWVRRPAVRLKAGLHRIGLASLGYQMPRIRSIVMAPESVPAPVGEPPEPVRHDLAGAELRGHVPRLPGVRAIKLVDADAATVTADGEVRCHLSPGRPIGPLLAEVEVEPGAVIRLQQDGCDLLLDGTTGDFLMLYDRQNDRLLAGDGVPQPLVAIQFKRAGEARWTEIGPDHLAALKQKEKYALGPWDLAAIETTPRRTSPEAVEVDPRGATVRHLFAVEGLGQARVTQRIEPAGGGVWRLAVTVKSLQGPADVVGVEFPCLPAVRIGESGLDDVQLRMMSFGHRRVQPGRQPLHDASYCGRVVMNWTQVYDRQASLYLGVHDPRGTTTVHHSLLSGPEGETVGLSAQRLDEIRPGDEITWETRLAVNGGGWHAGARLYGDWFTSVHGPADYPSWLRTSPGWLDLQIENYGREFRFDQLPDWLTRARAIGLDWVQAWGQFGYHGGPCCCAWYGPSPMYGGAEGWKRALTEIRRRGGHAGGYFIYDRFDRLPVWLDTFLGHFTKADYPDDIPWDDAAFQHQVAAVTDPAGSVPPARPTEGELAAFRGQIAEHRALDARGERAPPVQWWQTAYLPDPRWRAYLSGWIGELYVGRWGASTAYIDVLGTGDATWDFDPRRGNNGDGSWGWGRKLLAAEVVATARRHDPQFGLTMEGLGDLPGLHAAAMCSGVYQGNRNVVRYAFPDRVLIHGMANAGGHGTGGPLHRYLATFREGMRWDIVGRPTSLPVSLLNLTRPFLPELYQARFLDTEGLQSSDTRIEARHFDATGTRLCCRLITVTNPDGIDGTVRLTGPALGSATAALGIALDGRLLQSGDGDGGLTLPVDSSVPAAVWLVATEETAEPPLWPLLWADWSQPDGSGPITLVLLNLSSKPQKLTVEVQSRGYTEPFADQLPHEAAVRRSPNVTVQPRQSVAVPLSVSPAAANAYRRWSTAWSVKIPALELDRNQLLTPLLLDPSFELLDVGQGEGIEGRALVLGPTTDGYQHRLLDLWLLPGRRYRLTLQSKRDGFKAAVRGTLLRLSRAAGADQDHRWSLDPKRPDQWQQLGAEFITPPDLTRAALYLYNVRSSHTAWFDAIDIEDIGPLAEGR